jgi:site-specific recombinase XerD
MLHYFTAGKPLKDITAGDADLWRIDLISSGLAENTVRRSCGVAKQWFHFAVRQQLIEANPFGDFNVALKTNHDRFYFVSREEAAKVSEACPDAEWRLLFALRALGA